MNNCNKIKETKTNLIYYNKHFSTKKDDNIRSILFYENKKKEIAKFYFSNKYKKYYNIMIINKMIIIHLIINIPHNINK